MKVTADISDDLYRQVKAKAALEGRAVREVTEALYRAYVEFPDAEERISAGKAWLARWLEAARKLPRAPDGPTAREILEEGRNRLEPK